MVVKVKDVPKDKPVVKKLYKTKREEYPDLAKLRAEKEKQIIKKKKAIARQQREMINNQKAEKDAEMQQWDEAKYDFYDEDEMTSNTNGVDMDDFM